MGGRMYWEKTRSGMLTLLFLGVSVLWGYVPELGNPNLRLAAMGNLNIVIEDVDNEINFYDFGESAAGAIEDNNYKSQIYTSALYGYGVYDKTFSFREGHGTAVNISSIVKYGESFALGGAYSRSWIYNAYADPFVSTVVEENTSVTVDSILVAYEITPRLSAGVRGTYNGGHYVGEYTLEPSVMICAWPAWRLGLTYVLKRCGTVTGHEFVLPMVFTGDKLKLGVMGRIREGRYYDGEKSIRARTRYSIGNGKTGGRVALAAEYVTPYGFYDWILKAGGGVALEDRKLGVIGMQYSWSIEHIDLYDFWQLQTDYIDYHEAEINLGAEVRVLSVVAARLGYINRFFYSSRDIAVSRRDFATAGIGLRLSDADLSLDFAYNLKVWEFMGTDTTGYMSLVHDEDHTFGIMCRYSF
jgi:hypothetical protein